MKIYSGEQGMNIVLITQDDPFYLAHNIDYLINNLPGHSKIAACVLLDVSPFGKKETILQKAKKTYGIFGLRFFIRYSLRYLLNKFDNSKKVKYILHIHNIPIIELNQNINSNDSINKIKKYYPDLLISIAGNQIFKRPILELAPRGCLNLHTALLPKYRGLMPSFWVLKNNEEYTGASVFFVDEGIDSGHVLVQKKIEIKDMSLEKLIMATKKLGMDAIIESVNLIESENYKLIENDDSQKSYFHFPTKEDVKEFLKIGKRFY